MSVLPVNLRDILSVKFKSRYDSITDQYSRIFLPKMLFLCSLICGMDYFNDRVSCILTQRHTISTDFVHSTCWITGFYIYHEMENRIEKSAYYGIPDDISHDGIDEKGQLCAVADAHNRKKAGCTPMTRRYFNQYQWMTFFIASLSIIYYLPYLAFKMVNTDVISLAHSLKSDATSSDDIANNYFNYEVNSKSKMRLKILGNIGVKTLYVGINLMCFHATDFVLEGRFKLYGSQWCSWILLPNYLAHDFSKRNVPKPGNHLLPPWGFCELHKVAKDFTSVHTNRYQFVCEMSSNLIYQYVLLVLWFCFVTGIAISFVGWLLPLLKLLSTYLCIVRPGFRKGTLIGEMYALMTFREIEYLELLRCHDMPKYGDVLRKLTRRRRELYPLKRFFNSDVNGVTLL